MNIVGTIFFALAAVAMFGPAILALAVGFHDAWIVCAKADRQARWLESESSSSARI